MNEPASLADSLDWLCQHYRLYSPHSELTSLVNGAETSTYPVEKAAQLCGLRAQWWARPPANAPLWHYPLLIEDEQGFTLLVRQRPDGSIVRIHPQAPDSAVTVEAHRLSVSGYWQVRPQVDVQTLWEGGESHWHWRAVWAYWPWYGEVAIASILINIFALAMPLFVMNVYDRVVPHAAYETLWALASGVLIVLGFDFALRIARAWWLDTAGKNIDCQLSAHIHAHLLNLPLAHRPSSTGSLAAQLQEFEGFREYFSAATLTALIDLPFVFLFIGLIGWIGGTLAWLPLATVPLVLAIGVLLQWPLRNAIQRQMKAATSKHSLLVDTLRNIETVKAHNGASSVHPRWERLVENGAYASLQVKLWSAITVHFSLFAQQAAYLAVVIFGVYQIGAGHLTTGGLIACTILTGRALAPLAQIATLLARFHQSRAALRGIQQILAIPPERPPPGQRQYVNKRHWRGELSLEHVTFTYPGQAQPVLSDINIQFFAGEKIALIGHSGSGKTTLTRLLLGLYTPQHGHVLYDGLHLAQLDPLELRRHIGYVAQDSSLLLGTVRDNLLLGASSGVADEQLLSAAYASGLDEWLRRAPHGLGLQVGENGSGLSGGQRQLIALTRALVGNPPVLVWDEPANALDHHSEHLLKTRLESTLANKTLILATHRASLLTLVDRVVVLAGGKIIADGPKDAVLSALQVNTTNFSTNR